MKKVVRMPIPLWIALLVAVPLIVLFLLSLAAATAVAALAGVAYWLLAAPRRTAPLPERGETRRARGVEIELDPKDYRRIPDHRERS